MTSCFRLGAYGRASIVLGLVSVSVLIGASSQTDRNTSDAAGIPRGGAILFQERFDDDRFAARGWYDGPAGTITRTNPAPGSASAYECAFAPRATSCTHGKPARHAFAPSETIYASFWLRFSDNWVGSGRAYHPHMFQIISDRDDAFVGPAGTHLTASAEVVGGRALLALQDSKNVDRDCILRNDDSVAGCGGAFSRYTFTENRSVASCNGLIGDLQGRDCFPTGNGTWYSSRSWVSPGAFTDAPGPAAKNAWHFIEVYFAMNSIRNGVGVPDGQIRWVQDGRTLIASDRILMRTGRLATLRFGQFTVLPYIGDGSPVAQSFWVDDVTVATARP